MNLTRRDVIAMGAGVGAALLSRPLGLAAQAPLTAKTIPSTGERIPVVGIGAREYRAGAGVETERYRDTIATFSRLGGRLIDTAPSYGTSEASLGGILRETGLRDNLFMATKVDREGREAGMARMEDSFRALATQRIDLMQVHNLRDTDVQLATLRELKAAGRIRYIGITTSNDRQYPEFAEVMRRERLDFIQVDYSLANRGSQDVLLPLAADRGMAVLINLPFGRASLFRRVGDRALPAWAAEIGCTSWAQVFLKYVVSHPAVTCAIPGTTQARHAEDNLGAARGPVPDAVMRTTMERFLDQLPGG